MFLVQRLSFIDGVVAWCREVWPFRTAAEVRLFLPLALMMACILYNFGALRMLRDGIIVSYLGAEVLSFAEIYVSLPLAFLTTMGMFALYERGNLRFVFMVVCSIFIVFFVLFGWVWYPHVDFWHIGQATQDSLTRAYPNLRWIIVLWGHWSFALLHAVSELWAAALLNVLFWQLANATLSTEQAKRLYLLFGLVGNFGTIIAGKVLHAWAGVGKSDATYVQEMLMAVIGITLVMMLLFRWIQPHLALASRQTKAPGVAGRSGAVSVRSALMTVLRSPYLGLMTVMIMGYGISVAIVETQWRAYARILHPDTQSLTAYMGQFMVWIGMATMGFLCVGSVILRRFSWLTAGLIAPMMMGITSLLMLVITQWSGGMAGTVFHMSTMVMISYVGAIQNVLVKSSKYTLFDATKEMAFIPLDPVLKTQGKAAVDLIGNRTARSCGAGIQTVMLMLMPSATLVQLGPWMLMIVLVCVTFWILAVIGLSHRYDALTSEKA
jgi:AAA family ATP:ADP antiporter